VKKSVPHQNVTLSLPVPLLRQFRVYAAEQNRSMSSLAAAAIVKLVSDNDEYERAGKRLLKFMRNSPDRGTGGKITWTREQLYEEMFSERSKGIK
jgi:hypothetical protein